MQLFDVVQKASAQGFRFEFQINAVGVVAVTAESRRGLGDAAAARHAPLPGRCGPDVAAHREGARRHGRLGRPLAGDPREDEDRGPLERRAVLN